LTPTAESYRLVSISFTLAFESFEASSSQTRAVEYATASAIGVSNLLDFSLTKVSERRRLYAGSHLLGVDRMHSAVAAAWHVAHRHLLSTDVEVSFGVATNASAADQVSASISDSLVGSTNATAAFNTLLSELLNTTVVMDSSSLTIAISTRSPSMSPTVNSSYHPTQLPSSIPSSLPSALPSVVLTSCELPNFIS